MENFNIKLDRPTINSEEIAKNQNFDNVLSNFNKAKIPVYKNPWFWGSAGLATIGLTTVVSLNALTINTKTNDNKITLKTNDLPQDTECLKAPVKEEDIPFKTYHVNPSKDEKIVLESGTTIEIPKGALLATDQSRSVEINVREFRDKSSAFIAGVNMDFDKNHAFESAGMLEIRGSQNKNEVAISKDKPIEINLVTKQDPSNFGFWYLNESSKKWEDYPITKENDKKTSNLSSLVKLRKTEDKIQTISKEILEISSKLNSLKKPSKEEYKIPGVATKKYDLDFDKSEYPELASFKNVVFEVIPSPQDDSNFSKKSWSEIDLEKKGEKYLMKLKNSKESYQVYVRPVLSGSDLKEAEKIFDKELENFKVTKKELETTKLNLETEKKIHEANLKKMIQLENEKNQVAASNQNNQMNALRKVNLEMERIEMAASTINFQTTRFGVFNSDRPILYPKAFAGDLILLWAGNQVAKFRNIFVFNRDKNTRFSYGVGFFNSIDNIGFTKNDNLTLVGIDFDGNFGFIENLNDWKSDASLKLVFKRKENSESAYDVVKKLLNETSEVS